LFLAYKAQGNLTKKFLGASQTQPRIIVNKDYQNIRNDKNTASLSSITVLTAGHKRPSAKSAGGIIL